MLIRLLKETLARRPRRFAAAILAVAVSAALVASLLDISLDIGVKMAKEMRSYGANILVEPAASGIQMEIAGINVGPPAARGTVDEDALVNLKTIFWKNNILGFAPFLSAMVEVGGQSVGLCGTWFDKEMTLPAGFEQSETSGNVYRTGVRIIAPWWRVEGDWASDDDERSAMVGSVLARRLGVKTGDPLVLRYQGRERKLRVTGLVATGGYEEELIFVPLRTAQGLLGLRKGADRVLVSALVQPDDTLRPDLRGLDPDKMTPEQYATWYCSPVIGAVIAQIKEVIPGAIARPIRQVAEAEGAFLARLGLFMSLLAAATLGAAALAVMIAMAQAVLERRAEIGLMKALGADRAQVALIFLSEAALIGLAGGLLGFLAGIGLTAFISRSVFDAAASLRLAVPPLTLTLSLAVALLGSLLPVLQALKLEPIALLRVR